MEEANKFNESEVLVGGLFFLGIDGICVILDFLGIGLALSPVIQGFAMFIMGRWLSSKGDNAQKIGKQIAKYAAGLIPVIPTTFLIFLVETYLHNNPKIKNVVSAIKPQKISSLS